MVNMNEIIGVDKMAFYHICPKFRKQNLDKKESILLLSTIM